MHLLNRFMLSRFTLYRLFFLHHLRLLLLNSLLFIPLLDITPIVAGIIDFLIIEDTEAIIGATTLMASLLDSIVVITPPLVVHIRRVLVIPARSVGIQVMRQSIALIA